MRSSSVRRGLAALAPYRLHLFLLAYTPAVLVLDGLTRSYGVQLGLGAVTLLVLLFCLRRLDLAQRRQVWACVAVATGFEVVGSILWGVYRYSLHDIPLYVPFGHGLVYLFGLTAAATPLMQKQSQSASRAVLAVCAAWAVSGLTWLPLLTHRLDVQGALCFPIFAFALTFSPRRALFAAIFVICAELELVGTLMQDWTWAARAPWDLVPSGNPPSAIAGGYCIIDGSVMLLLRLGGRVPGWRRAPARRSAPVHPGTAGPQERGAGATPRWRSESPQR